MSSDSSNFKDNQKYKIDIEKIYSSIIEQIDNIRSHVSTANNSAKLKAFIKSANSTNSSTKSILSQVQTDVNNFQESRCHAFYRLIGLPVFEPAGTSYSPGLNRDSNKKSDFLKYKKLVAAGIPDDLYGLMDKREVGFNNYLQIFSIPNINSSVLALSIVSPKPRNFNILSISAVQDPFDSKVEDQTYSFDNTSNYSGTGDLTVYQDSNGNVATSPVLGYLSKRSHIIAPLMVDPRVELTINPPYIGSAGQGAICKIVGAPFALDKSQLLYIENIYATRPIIETVCRQRLNISQPESKLSDRFQKILNYVKNTDLVTDPDLLNKVFENPTLANEDQVFLKYINIMKAMVDKMVEALQIIADTEMEYHWVPIPDKKGPEFGSTTQGIIIGDPNIQADSKEQAIINKILDNEVAQINSNSSTITQPDLGNFTDINIAPSPDDTTTDAIEDRSQNEFTSMTEERDKKTSAANDALRTIEIILGEFSGLGLCDIIAVYLALWTIDRESLVNMLDSESFARLSQIKELQSEEVKNRQSNNNMPPSGFDIVTVMTKFEQRVSEIYTIMDKLMLDRLTNNFGTI